MSKVSPPAQLFLK